MYVYRNHNTGDRVELAKRSARLDHLQNWELIAEPDTSGAPGPAGVPEPGKLPAKSASKKEWVTYAVGQSMDPEEAEKLTRDELAEKYATAVGDGDGN
jgi:hypothetical protein